tara:strand:- start:300 stop:1139 length:840 start_codon:yes stop_codon:yes gene_type:complete
MGYFTVEVIPTIAASKQAAFANKDVLFDWTSFQVPRGANKLVSVTAIFKGTNGGVQTARDMDLFFAKSISGVAPVTLGAVNGTVTAAPITTNHMLGMAHIDTADYGQSSFDFMNMAQTGSGAAASLIPNMVLEGELSSGDNVGYDTLYLGGIAGGAFDFGTNALTTGAVDVSGLSTATVGSMDDGSGGDALATKKFAVGDIIHATDDIILGEILTIDSDAAITFRTGTGTTLDPAGSYSIPVDLTAWKIQNGAGAAGDLANNDELFNIHPIKIVLSFEK